MKKTNRKDNLSIAMVLLLAMYILIGYAPRINAQEINQPENYFKYYSLKKDPGLSLFSGILVPSLGHYIAGDWLRSWPFALGEAATIYQLTNGPTQNVSVYTLIFAALKIWEGIDAYNTAENQNKILANEYSLDLSQIYDQEKILYMKESNKFTWGIFGADGSAGLGATNVDTLGYPRGGLNFNGLMGMTYSWYWNTPSKEEIYETVKVVSWDKNNPLELKEKVKAKVKRDWYNYFRFGTLAIWPLIANGGWETRLNDTVRFSYGFGLPLLFSFGFNADF